MTQKQLELGWRIIVATQQGRLPIPDRPTIKLLDGTVGYCMRRPDDCFAAALATTLQLPISRVPDPHIDEHLANGWPVQRIHRARIRQLDAWLLRHKFRAVVHRTLPVRHRRWIGIVRLPGDFNDHCLVMVKNEVLFDPSQANANVQVFRPDDVAVGISFQSIRTKEGQ